MTRALHPELAKRILRWRRRPCMRRLLVPALIASVGFTGCRPRSITPLDSPSHDLLSIGAAPGVRLEMLDWGGSGEPMVFLTGLGNSAHVFDDFAPRFTDAYRVYGLTRRGFGGSSRPADGYDLRTRAGDILAVLDSLGIARAVLVGHSLAGDEMSHIAVRHPERVRALVYLDAYDYGPEFAKMRDESPEVPPGIPAMTSEDSASIESFMAYRKRAFGTAYPIDEVRAHIRFGPDGRFQGSVPRSHREVGAGVGIERADYASIAAPALAIYADVPSVSQAYPDYGSYDLTTKAKADTAFAMFDEWRKGVIFRFRSEVRGGTVVELKDADHYVFLSNPREVERLMRDFLSRSIGSLSEATKLRG